MFRLSVVDHVRLTFGHVAQNYTVHARAAERLARLAWRARIVILVLVAAAAAIAGVDAVQSGRPYQIAAAITAALALIGFTVYLASTIEARVYAHRALAHRLWLVSEDYRSLLAEVQDGFIDRDAVLRRRDDLIRRAHDAYDQPFPVDEPAFESVRQAAREIGTGVAGDDEITSPSASPSSVRRATA
jgi:hypothetical protein